MFMLKVEQRTSHKKKLLSEASFFQWFDALQGLQIFLSL